MLLCGEIALMESFDEISVKIKVTTYLRTPSLFKISIVPLSDAAHCSASLSHTNGYNAVRGILAWPLDFGYVR